MFVSYEVAAKYYISLWDLFLGEFPYPLKAYIPKSFKYALILVNIIAASFYWLAFCHAARVYKSLRGINPSG